MSIKQRFVIKEYGQVNEHYWGVIDIECDRWNTYERAVNLYFQKSAHAQEIADLLNDEWQRFLRNPT